MKKLLVFLTGEQEKKKYQADPISKWFGELKENGVEISYVVDSSLDSNDNPGITPRLRMEKEGPEWAKYNQETLDAVKDAEMILVGYNGVNSTLLAHAEKLKFVGVLRSGVENINVAACTEKGVAVSACPGRLGESVSDFTVTMMLACNRNISRDDLSKRAGWKYPGYDNLPRALLMKDAVVGLVGLGSIGRKVAQRIAGFGSRIIAYDPFVKPEEAAKIGIEMKSLEEVMSTADFVSVHARLVPATRGMIGAEQLALMKPSAFFINTARAGLVDEEALIRLLQEHKIRGAGLDVFLEEPLPEDHPLRKLDNVILSPHNAGGAGNLLNVSMEIMKDELLRYCKGEPLRNKMN